VIERSLKANQGQDNEYLLHHRRRRRGYFRRWLLGCAHLSLSTVGKSQLRDANSRFLGGNAASKKARNVR
jgi:hypothetical protein